MPTCANCDAKASGDLFNCPVCGNRLHPALLVREMTGLERIVNDSVARLVTEQQVDRGTAIAALEAAQETTLEVSLLQPAMPTIDEIVRMLEPGNEGSVQFEKINLVGLFDKKGQQADVLRKGLFFLRRHLFAEALEWWTLHRQTDTVNERFDLLLLLMQMYTHRLASHPEAAAQVRDEVKRHPAYGRMAVG